MKGPAHGMHLHEDLSRRPAEEKSGERALGITFAAVFLVVGLVRWHQGHAGWSACLVAAAIFLCLAWFWIAPLRPLNNLWHRFGLLLFHVVNPVIMGVVFFSTIFPIGLMMRIFGKGPLELSFDRAAPTYWKKRIPSAAISQSMKNQS